MHGARHYLRMTAMLGRFCRLWDERRAGWGRRFVWALSQATLLTQVEIGKVLAVKPGMSVSSYVARASLAGMTHAPGVKRPARW